MVWWKSRREAVTDAAALQEAEKAMEAIFTPSHVTVHKASDTGATTLWRTDVCPVEKGDEPAAAVTTTTTTTTTTTKNNNSAGRARNGACAPLSRGEEAKEAPILRTLPPSPIAGYALREEGIVDELVSPPRTLSVSDVRSLIAELSSIEQKAKYDIDAQLPQQVHNRGRRGVEFIINPCLYMCGMYLLLWKTPRLYLNASPRSSLFFTQILALMRWHLPEAKKEMLARNHRRLLQATNARVTLSCLAGLGVTTVAVVTRPLLDVADVSPDVEVAMQSVGFQKHSEAALRWLWLVYYHHPAYQSLGNLHRSSSSTG